METLVKLVAGFAIFAASLFADYTTYIGDQYIYQTTALTADASGNTYITGSRILAASIAGNYGPGGPLSDVFVIKLDPAGKILFTQTFGGTGTDQALAIALDPSGDIYVAGGTTSLNFPLVNALQTSPQGGAFVVKLSPDGGTLLYSTYFADGFGAQVNSIATDTKGNLYLTGLSWADPINQYAFVSEISAAGDRIVYSIKISGTQPVCNRGIGCPGSEMQRLTAGVGIAVDPQGNAFVAGNTNTVDLPVTSGAFLGQGGIGAFVAKVIEGGSSLGYLTYLGTGDFIPPLGDPVVTLPAIFENTLHAIAVDPTGNAYLGGSTSDVRFPATSGAYQTTYTSSSENGSTDGFLAKLNATGSQLIWATYLGGSGVDSVQSLAVDSRGNVFASGITASADFPNANGWTRGGDFLVEMNSTGSALEYAAQYPSGTVAQSVARDPATGLVHVAGTTGIVSGIATSQPPTLRPFGVTNAAAGPITGRISPGEVIAIYGPHIGPSTPATATADSQGLLPTTLAGVQVSIGGVNAPLLYVSDSQINAVVPLAGNPSELRISNNGEISPGFPVVVVDAVPQVFQSPSTSASPISITVAINEDGTVNSNSNPAPVGSVVSIWATGTGVNPFQVLRGKSPQRPTIPAIPARSRITKGRFQAPMPIRRKSSMRVPRLALPQA
jgi:uncharacterized protein (TIGR03437 family)